MRLLFVVSRYPWPADRGDKVRAVQFLELLGSEHEVTLLAPEGPAGAPLPRHRRFQLETYRTSPWSRLRGFSRCLRRGLPWQAGLFYQSHLSVRLRELGEQADLVILQLARLATHLPDLGDRPMAVDLIDSLALNFRRRADLESPLRKPAFRHEAQRLARCEADLLARAQRVWVVSDRDRQAMAADIPAADLKRLQVLPLAFPLAESKSTKDAAPPEAVPSRTTTSERLAAEGEPILALTGNLGYFPNVDGFCWWLEEVWPRLRAKVPGLSVVLAGARPAKKLRRAVAAAGAGVRLIAAPKDLKAVLRQATLAMAPMRCGSGQPLKILEAWECGVAVVASPWAAAGVALDWQEALRIAPTAEEWVQAVEVLLRDDPLRFQMISAGREALAQAYDRSSLRKALLASLESVPLEIPS